MQDESERKFITPVQTINPSFCNKFSFAYYKLTGIETILGQNTTMLIQQWNKAKRETIKTVKTPPKKNLDRKVPFLTNAILSDYANLIHNFTSMERMESNDESSSANVFYPIPFKKWRKLQIYHEEATSAPTNA